jgi:GNAT superfamily N-acetyltransferase
MTFAELAIRQATPADAEAIRALTRAAYAKWVPRLGREPKPMTADYDAAVRAHRFDLLYRGAALAGLIETIDEPPHQLLVENVAIAPQFQGQGLGRQLLAHAEGLARDLGRRGIRLYTNQRLVENVALYQRLGYAIDNEEDVGVAVVTHMSKAVSSA